MTLISAPTQCFGHGKRRRTSVATADGNSDEFAATVPDYALLVGFNITFEGD